MRIVAIAAVALLIVAAGSQLYVLQQHQSISFLQLLLRQPLPQQAAWLVILAAPLILLFAALWGQERMLQHRKRSEALSAELRGVREGMKELQTAQKDNEDAVSYLTRGNPESSLDDLRQRLSAVEQPIELHHSRNEAADLLASIEQVREQQKVTRERLSRVIAKRASLETAIADLQRFQDEAEQAMARMEEDKHGDTLDTRLRKLIDFSRNAHFRCDEIEGSLQGIAHQEKEFAEVKSRLAPLVDPESGVRKRLRLLQDLRGGLAGSLEEVERDGGIPLPDRVKELAESRSGLEQRIADVKLRCEEIERALEAMTQQQKEFDATRARLAPLLDAQTGVRTRMRVLQDTRADLTGALEGIERDGGIPLPERVQQFAESKAGLELRVLALLEQVTKIETVQQEISALFARLNQAHRVSHELDGSLRIVSQMG